MEDADASWKMTERNGQLRADDDDGDETFSFKVIERDAAGSMMFERRWAVV